MWKALASVRHEGLLVVAIVFGAAAMVEGGVATWGVLYLRSNLGVGVLAGVTRVCGRAEPGDGHPHRRRRTRGPPRHARVDRDRGEPHGRGPGVRSAQ